MKVDLISGFLGSGKTTFIRYLLPSLSGKERIAVLVNEFGQIGIDGTLLRGLGGDVVELPGGCICCSLKADFRGQIKSIAKRFRPDRLIIEPTGVATVSQMLNVLHAVEFDKLIDVIRVILIVDASAIKTHLATNKRFFESQIKSAPIIILNKCDRVPPLQASMLQQMIAHINPSAKVLLASFGQIDIEELGIGADMSTLPEEDELTQYESFSASFTAQFSRERLLSFFASLSSEHKYGEVARAKGIFCADGRWIRIDLASGVINVDDTEHATTSRTTIIGVGLKRDLIAAGLSACTDPTMRIEPSVRPGAE